MDDRQKSAAAACAESAESAGVSVGALLAAVAAVSLLVAGCGRAPAVAGHRPLGTAGAHVERSRISGRLLAVGGPAGVKAERLPGTVTAVDIRTHGSFAAAVRSNGRYVMHLPAGRYRLLGRSPRYLSGEPSCHPARPVVTLRRGAVITADVLCQQR